MEVMIIVGFNKESSGTDPIVLFTGWGRSRCMPQCLGRGGGKAGPKSGVWSLLQPPMGLRDLAPERARGVAPESS